MPVYFNCSTIPIKQTGKVPKDIDFYTFGSLVHPRVGWLGWWWPANSINFQANILGHDKLWMGWGVPIVHIFKSLHDGAQPIKNSNHESSSQVVMDRHELPLDWYRFQPTDQIKNLIRIDRKRIKIDRRMYNWKSNILC